MRAVERLRATGLRRLGTPGGGFRWVTPRGRPAGVADAGRARALRLPPAWTDVHASPSAARLQGREAQDVRRRHVNAYIRRAGGAGAKPLPRAARTEG